MLGLINASLFVAGISFLGIWHADYQYQTRLRQGDEDVKPPTQITEEMMPCIHMCFDALDAAAHRWSLALHIR